jgi:hypothetical protein
VDGEEWLAERSVLAEEGYKPEWFTFSSLGGYLTLQVRLRGKGVERD